MTIIDVSQIGVEVARESDSTNLRVTQGGVEVGNENDFTNIVVAQAGIEIAYLDRPPIPTPASHLICHPPYAQLHYPISEDNYAVAPLSLLGVSNGTLLVAISGTGTPPLHYLTQRGPYQHGSTALDYRWDERTVALEIFKEIGGVKRENYLWDLLNYLRPSRTFYTGVTVPIPLRFRYYLPGGDLRYGMDLELTNGSAVVYSPTGRFVHFGLDVGEVFVVSGSTGDDGTYRVVEVPNDYSITLDTAMTATEGGVSFRFRMTQAYRDLFLLMTVGPQDNQPNQVYPAGISDTLELTAHDPFWYGREQEEVWDLSGAFDALVFDDVNNDAWFGDIPGEGTWLFADNYLSREVAIVYWGHEPVNPVISITGPANLPIITNSEAGVTLVFNYNIAAGEVVIIDTLNLTVTNNFGQSLYTYITGDVATFQLAPDPQAPSRINTVSMTFAGASANSKGVLRWRNKYINR